MRNLVVSQIVRKIIVIVISCGVLIMLLAYLSGAFHKKIAPEKIAAEHRALGDAKTDLVHKVLQTEEVEVVGTLRAERRTEISARIMATIMELPVRAGDRVKEGALLARLDDRDLKASLAQAQQGEVGAKASMEEARKELERTRTLVENRAASTQDFDSRETAFKVAEAKVEQARQATLVARTMLSHAVIKSPVEGVVVDKLVDVGDTANPGRPLLALYDPSALRLEAAVPEALVAKLKRGDILEMKIASTDPEKMVSGTIEEIVPQAAAASRSVMVKVRIAETMPGMVEGGFGRLLIPGRERVRLCLPLAAVRKVGQLRFVDVVMDDKTLERRMVTLGEHSRLGRVEVLSGIDADERVVLHGPPPEALPPGVMLFPEGAEL